jgi:hypothetical protein
MDQRTTEFSTDSAKLCHPLPLATLQERRSATNVVPLATIRQDHRFRGHLISFTQGLDTCRQKLLLLGLSGKNISIGVLFSYYAAVILFVISVSAGTKTRTTWAICKSYGLSALTICGGRLIQKH